MLMITRKRGERILIALDPETDPTLTAAALFATGPIEIVVAHTSAAAARLAVTTARPLRVRRAAARTDVPSR